MSEPVSQQHYEEIIHQLEGTPADVEQATRRLAKDDFLYLQLEKTMSKKQVSPDLVEELFNEGLAILVENIRRGKFNRQSSLPTYFVGICKILVLQKNKPSAVTLVGDDAAFAGLSPSVEAGFIEAEEAQELQQLVRHSLSRLGAKCQRVLEMIKRNFPMEVIAREMHWEYQTARNNASDCRKKLRQLILNDPDLYHRIKVLR